MSVNGVIGVRIKCQHCKTFFIVCVSCYRGQRYCQSSCRMEARAISRRWSQKRYQQSPKGKLVHQLKQKRYRERKNKKSTIVTDHSAFGRGATSTTYRPWNSIRVTPSSSITKPESPKFPCRNCNVEVEWLPAKGLFRSWRSKISPNKSNKSNPASSGRSPHLGHPWAW